jgi:hypothetical protein
MFAGRTGYKTGSLGISLGELNDEYMRERAQKRDVPDMVDEAYQAFLNYEERRALSGDEDPPEWKLDEIVSGITNSLTEGQMRSILHAVVTKGVRERCGNISR